MHPSIKTTCFTPVVILSVKTAKSGSKSEMTNLVKYCVATNARMNDKMYSGICS